MLQMVLELERYKCVRYGAAVTQWLSRWTFTQETSVQFPLIVT